MSLQREIEDLVAVHRACGQALADIAGDMQAAYMTTIGLPLEESRLNRWAYFTDEELLDLALATGRLKSAGWGDVTKRMLREINDMRALRAQA